MAALLNLIICVLLGFTALGLACAVAIALRRDARIGLRQRHPQPDPFFYPLGDVYAPDQLRLLNGAWQTTPPETGFTAAELDRVAPRSRSTQKSFDRRPSGPKLRLRANRHDQEIREGRRSR